jgi:voltage-gated potassium channel
VTTSATPPEAPHETRLERRLESAVDRATTPRGAAVVIASASIAVTVASAVLMTIVDRANYPSFGSGLWWAIQTTTTVGYGDNVPTTFAGRSIAAVVMMFGIGFLTVITASITSTFVARSRLEQTRGSPKLLRRSNFAASTSASSASRPGCSSGHRTPSCRRRGTSVGSKSGSTVLGRTGRFRSSCLHPPALVRSVITCLEEPRLP